MTNLLHLVQTSLKLSFIFLCSYYSSPPSVSPPALYPNSFSNTKKILVCNPLNHLQQCIIIQSADALVQTETTMFPQFNTKTQTLKMEDGRERTKGQSTGERSLIPWSVGKGSRLLRTAANQRSIFNCQYSISASVLNL